MAGESARCYQVVRKEWQEEPMVNVFCTTEGLIYIFLSI